jgi:hypothetical protein
MTSYSSLTEYPKIYSKTYWGAFSKDPEQPIIVNRNLFIKKYNIKIYKRLNRKMFHFYDYRERILDHVESYITKNKYVIIVTSPYAFNGNSTGWYEIEQLYSSYTTTFMKVFKDNKEIHLTMEELLLLL